MFRYLPFALFLLCPTVHAECAVNRADAGGLSISVSGDGHCFRSPQERQVFAESFKSAVRDESVGSENGRRRPMHDSHEALNGFDHLRRQSEVLSGRGPVYYGQRR
jgi:hypothetical protein